MKLIASIYENEKLKPFLKNMQIQEQANGIVGSERSAMCFVKSIDNKHDEIQKGDNDMEEYAVVKTWFYSDDSEVTILNEHDVAVEYCHYIWSIDYFDGKQDIDREVSYFKGNYGRIQYEDGDCIDYYVCKAKRR